MIELPPYHPPMDPPVILHEDRQLLIVNKPAGLLSVPGIKHKDCLQHRLLKIRPESLLIHRLDMDTSGIMVFARTKLAQRHLNKQFEDRKVDKRYVAIVAGQMGSDEGLVDAPLIADWPNRPLQKICHDRGKPSQTRWQVDRRMPDTTRVLLAPRTGRSHQLRVHMASLGHPILGDIFYDGPPAQRLHLHARSLEFHHPDGGRRVQFTAECDF